MFSKVWLHACLLDCMSDLTNNEQLPVVSAVRNKGQVMRQVLSFSLSLVSASLLGTTVLFAEVMKAQRQFSLNLPNIRINFNSVRFSLDSTSSKKAQGDGRRYKQLQNIWMIPLANI